MDVQDENCYMKNHTKVDWSANGRSEWEADFSLGNHFFGWKVATHLIRGFSWLAYLWMKFNAVLDGLHL